MGLGAALHQRDTDLKEYFLAFASWTLLPTKKKWILIELENLAIVWAVEILQIYVEGTCTLMRTDHSPLLGLSDNADKTAKLEQWFYAYKISIFSYNTGLALLIELRMHYHATFYHTKVIVNSGAKS